MNSHLPGPSGDSPVWLPIDAKFPQEDYQRLLEDVAPEELVSAGRSAFFVLEPQVFDYIEGDMVMFEHAPLENLARDGQLMVYKHRGFWQCMDTYRDYQRRTPMLLPGFPPRSAHVEELVPAAASAHGKGEQ